MRNYDPLTFIPDPKILTKHLRESELLSARLRLLLRVSRKIARCRRLGKRAVAR